MPKKFKFLKEEDDILIVPKPKEEDVLDSEEFFNLMQAYRHAQIYEQEKVMAAFDNVKSYVRNNFGKKR